MPDTFTPAEGEISADWIASRLWNRHIDDRCLSAWQLSWKTALDSDLLCFARVDARPQTDQKREPDDHTRPRSGVHRSPHFFGGRKTALNASCYTFLWGDWSGGALQSCERLQVRPHSPYKL